MPVQADGFDLLYAAHKKQVYSLCLRMTRNPAEAEDMLQEVFLHLLHALPSYRREAKFSTWLHRVAVNVVLGKLRIKRLNTVSIHEQIATEDGNKPLFRYGIEDRNILGSADRIAIERSIQELPVNHRLIFLLHTVYGCDRTEIAKTLNISSERVNALLHKTRHTMRKSLLKRLR